MKNSQEINKWLSSKNEKLLKRFKKSGHDDIDENTIVDDKPPKDIKKHKKVKISSLLNENFYRLFSTENKIEEPYRLFKGGRSSFKSSAISIKLVTNFLKHDKGNTIAFRKVGKYLSTSVYEQIKWAIYKLNVQGEFTFLKSPLKIIHDKTNTAFYFYGVDDPLKIKSHKIAEGYVVDLWFEEAAEFEGKEEIDTVTDTFIREELPNEEQLNIYFSYNPPRNPYVWINEWVEEIEKNEDYYIHHSTYKEDKKNFLSKQFIKKVKQIEATDKDYHDWMYGGKVIGLGDVVYNYNLFNRIDKLSNDEKILFADLAIDTGYSTSATSFLFIGYTSKRNCILLDTYYYSPVNQVNKKAPSEFSKDLWNFVQDNIKKWNINIDKWTIDSAEGALRNQFVKDYGLRLHPVAKKQKIKMIENVEDILAQNRVFVLNTKNNKVFLDEHKKYQWDEKSLKTADPKVIKIDDHTCDAFQYYVNDNLTKLELK